MAGGVGLLGRRLLSQAPGIPVDWPTVDPLRTTIDIWFPAGRLPNAAGTGARPRLRDERALEVGRVLTARAEGLAGREPQDLKELVSLRVLAAEWKRIGGAPEEAFADYEVLARHYREVGSFKAAIAYMRKALHVSKDAADPGIRFRGRMIAIDVYRGVARHGRMTEHAHAAAAIAAEGGLDREGLLANGIIEELRAADREKTERCGCGKGRRYWKCCGKADVDPVEFSPAALEFPVAITGGPFRFRGTGGLESLMRPPDGTEALTWYAWRVEDGCHRLMANPNWSGRAMRAAEKMAEMARAEDCPYAASSAVLQAFVAVEAFLTSWRSLDALEAPVKAPVEAPAVPGAANDASSGGAPASAEVADAAAERADTEDHRRLVESWSAFASTRLGPAWRFADEGGFRNLSALRNWLCHHASSLQEVVPGGKVKRDPIPYLDTLKLGLRAAPSPRIDRVMTADVADWAVRIARGEIKAVRKAWKRDERLEEWLAAWQNQDDDAEAEAEAAALFDRALADAAGGGPRGGAEPTWFTAADPLPEPVPVRHRQG